MRCAICGIRIDSVDQAVEQGWIPYFYDGTQMHDVACPSCSQTLLRQGDDGEIEVKAEFRGKLKYLDKSAEETWQDHSDVVAAVLECESGKLN
jgi:hypothetical protein